MASPQVENGYVRVAGELMDAVTRINLSPYESRVFWFVVRRTYGFNKKMDRISLSQFSTGTGIDPRNARRTVKTLFDRNILQVDKPKVHMVLYGVQKNYERWLRPLSPQTVSLKTDSVQTLSSIVSDSVSTDRHKRQKTITKDSRSFSQNGFDQFWGDYPKKRNKGQAEKAWKSIKPDSDLLKTMLETIKRAKGCPDWLKEGGRYIPYPATWLNARGWEDQIQGGDADDPYKYWPVFVDCRICGDAHNEGEPCPNAAKTTA